MRKERAHLGLVDNVGDDGDLALVGSSNEQDNAADFDKSLVDPMKNKYEFEGTLLNDLSER